ncbi:hypothetical protein BKA67DRAFT_662196 [Truncatella angustata]|uniref:Uncharacterized protein n=1 Tax=Truncatella angustata TaxID=152316 RepID=A0A9P8RK77_9PEZI|nr:uncharacterized protein BKA67DRAFT_662196 [Truncatella angustata]KAH6647399.1 hypothetical protein BKA67DRAFT_662196 [Truncatella angustata]
MAAMATSIALSWPVSLISVGNLMPQANPQRRSRLLRFLQDLRNLDVPNYTDLTEALNFYQARGPQHLNAGMHAYIHFKVLDIPKLNKPLPKSMYIYIPVPDAMDISLPYVPLSVSPSHPNSGGEPKYHFVFFIYRHRPDMHHDPGLAANRADPYVIYIMS